MIYANDLNNMQMSRSYILNRDVAQHDITCVYTQYVLRLKYWYTICWFNKTL